MLTISCTLPIPHPYCSLYAIVKLKTKLKLSFHSKASCWFLQHWWSETQKNSQCWDKYLAVCLAERSGAQRAGRLSAGGSCNGRAAHSLRCRAALWGQPAPSGAKVPPGIMPAAAWCLVVDWECVKAAGREKYVDCVLVVHFFFSWKSVLF